MRSQRTIDRGQNARERSHVDLANILAYFFEVFQKYIRCAYSFEEAVPLSISGGGNDDDAMRRAIDTPHMQQGR